MMRDKNDAARVDSGDGGALLEGGSSGEDSFSGDSLAGGELAGRKHDPNDGPTLDSLKAGQCAIIKAVRGHGELRRHLYEHPEHFDPRQYLTDARNGIREMVRHKIVDVLGCNGKD